jgi:hypothetical protein
VHWLSGSFPIGIGSVALVALEGNRAERTGMLERSTGAVTKGGYVLFR